MGKRGNNEGSIYKRKDGRWEAKLTIGYDADGKPIRKSSYHKTRREAQDAMRDAQTRLASNLAQLDTGTTLREWSEIWLENKKSVLKQSTYENYFYALKHILPPLGHLKLCEIKNVQLQAFLNELGKTKGKSALQKVRIVLYGMLDEAEKNELVTRNAARGLKMPLNAEPEKKREAFTPEEIALIEENAKKIDFADVITMLINTGLREGELLAMRRQNVNTENACIYITHSATRINGKPTLGTPKTQESVRTIPVSDWVLKLIAARLPPDDGFIFQCRNGDIWSPRSFLRAYKKALEQMGIRYLSPHCCRHTYATRLHAAGADTKTIQTLMGHTDYALTANIYTHVNESTLRKAVDLLNKTA
jgi:integrase